MFIHGGKMYSSESDSDSDSIEEIQIRRYLGSFSDRIRQAKVQIGIKSGLKRQPGHYHLRDRRHTDLEPRRQGYDGKNWEVSLPIQLQRSTPRLTRYMIGKLIKQEQKSRVQGDQEGQQMLAIKSLEPLVQEFKGIILYNSNRLAKERGHQIAEVEKLKDSVQWEMLRKKLIKQHSEEAEEERTQRIKVLNGLLDNDKRTPSIEDLLIGMAETNYKRSMLNKDLTEAQENLEHNKNEESNNYHTAMSEMLDESLGKVVHTFATNETKTLCAKEQIRQVAEQNNQQNPSKNQKTKMEVLMELKKAFEKVETEEQRAKQKERTKLIDMKVAVQEELLRKVASKWVDVAIAEERSRRILEASNTNPTLNRMRHLVSRVQRQMLLEKFRGTWVNIAEKLEMETEASVDRKKETEVDKQLRRQRENQRRAIGVRSGVAI